jgi:hypothetical protein
MSSSSGPSVDWIKKRPWDSAHESSDQIRALNSEAFQFFGFALAAYSLQVAFAAAISAGPLHRFPFIGALALVLVTDALTLVLTAALVARYDLASLIFEWWPPWVYADEIIEKAREQGKTNGRRLDIVYARAWFHKERIVFGARPPVSWLDRRLSHVKHLRQPAAFAVAVTAISLPGWWILTSTWGVGWPFN